MSERTGPDSDQPRPDADNPYKHLAETSDIDRSVLEIWGPAAQEYFNELAQDHPDWDQEQLLRHFESFGVNPFTMANRENNVREIGQLLDILEPERPGESIQILEVGCANGQETYSLAVNALVHGHNDFHISAVDVNPESLDSAQRGEFYLGNYVQNIDSRHGHPTSGWRREDVQEGYLESTNRTQDGRPGPFYGPSQAVRSHVDFARHDIIDGPVPGEYDLVVINNVLAHFTAETREKALANALQSLRPGGLLTLEVDVYLDSGSAGAKTGYAKFRRELGDDPRLEPVQLPDDDADSLWRSLYRKREAAQINPQP